MDKDKFDKFVNDNYLSFKEANLVYDFIKEQMAHEKVEINKRIQIVRIIQNKPIIEYVADLIEILKEDTNYFPGSKPSIQNNLITGITNILKAYVGISGNIAKGME